MVATACLAWGVATVKLWVATAILFSKMCFNKLK